jgi:acetylornithine deacetylase
MQPLTSTVEMPVNQLADEAIALLKQLIAIPSFSREEDKTADLLAQFMQSKGIVVQRKLNNICALNKYCKKALPTLLLNSHHDTVKPNAGYSLNPFEPIVKDGKLYGLGSNDAGGALVSLLATFIYFYDKTHLKYNLVFAATAEEEISGENGIRTMLPDMGAIDIGIVGEPTQMNLAIAEKGLMVLDCTAYGVSGHAAREEGENALYKALKDIEWFRTFQFPKVSEALGSVKMSVTVINAGTQHNVVPDRCFFTVDVRTTDKYTNEEALEIIRQHVQSEIKPRSTRINSSGISKEHPLVKAGVNLGRKTFGSPTTSDQALMDFPTVKIGPGDSARSHTADEYIYVEEIKEGIELYIKMLKQLIE